jgi:hypothetical protein
VYLVTSPDYCEFDVKRGSLGTKGRECDPVGFTSRPPRIVAANYLYRGRLWFSN